MEDGCCSGAAITNSGDNVNNFIAFDWGDLNPSNGGTVTYQTIALDGFGNASITPQEVDNVSTDFCGSITNLSLDQLDFTCADIGENKVTCSATITVEDNITPTTNCQVAVINLNENGEGSISTADINNASSDNCTAANLLDLSLSQSDFTCADDRFTTRFYPSKKLYSKIIAQYPFKTLILPYI